MGLLAVLSLEECQMTKELFFAAYTKDTERLFSLLMKNTDISTIDKDKFKQALEACLEKIQQMPVTSYFTEMINVYIEHNLGAPDFLFKMAKAFICLNGINCFSDNTEKATELLKKQVIEYCVTKTIKDSYSFSIKCLNLAPKMLTSVLKYGLEKGIAEQIDGIETIFSSGETILSDAKTMLLMFQKTLDEESKQKYL